MNAKKILNELVIEIGLPDPCLNPNKAKSTHWAELGACRKTQREAVVNTVQMLHPEYVNQLWEAAEIKYDFYHTVNRTRDDDNFRAMMKSARDGFSPEKVSKRGKVSPGVGLVVDDTFIRDTQEVGFHIDKDHPRVRITLTRSHNNVSTQRPQNPQE